MRNLKTVSSKYELYLLQLLLCRLLALLSAIKLLSDRAKSTFTDRLMLMINTVLDKSINEFYLGVIQVNVLSRSLTRRGLL